MKFITLGRQHDALTVDDFRAWLQLRGHAVAITQDDFDTVDDVPTTDQTPAGLAASAWLIRKLAIYAIDRTTPPWDVIDADSGLPLESDR